MGRDAVGSQPQPETKSERKLSELKVGAKGVITSLQPGGDFRHRLIEMGIRPGARFELFQVAPMGDPIDVKIQGSFLSLRRSEAEKIIVTLGELA
ncbi:FeoA family protein [Chrysiogenes arsenatis]|uniref:FeoA family protein n=1 Tax=Chrysiogenes arsenatis TaxID=309797 RepID=UPI0003FFEE8F|nr:FeoA family protein [Chrysiogenes arsenatis]